MFLSQALDADPSCRQAVARLQAWRAARGQPACGAGTGGYCKARARRAEADLHRLVQHSGQKVQAQARAAWLWKGRRVPLIDGTTATLPETPANQAAYPQPDGQKPGLGFPLIRLVALLCLAPGALRDAALAP
jgi:hypothetical protein